MKNILIVGSSKLPIPAVKGGAVPNLIEELIIENEKKSKMSITCLSCYDDEAFRLSAKYIKTNFFWVKYPRIICFFDSMVSYIAEKIFKINRILSLSYIFRVLWMIIITAVYIKKENFDYIIFENSIPLLWSLRLFGNGKKYKNKYYFHIHTVPRHYYNCKKQIKNSKKILCISNYVKESIKKELNLEEDKFLLLFNSIDTEIFKPIEKDKIKFIRKKYNLPIDKHCVLFFGRLCKDKGIEELLDASLFSKNDYVIVIVGSNFYKTNLVSEYEKKIYDKSKKISKEVIFTGYIDYSNISEIINCVDIVVLPSMWDEPAGMTIIESMACGKVVITTKSGGIPEYTGSGNCVLLDRNGDISRNIAENIDKYLDNDNIRKKMEKNASKRVKIFNKEYYYETFYKIVNGGDF